MAQPKRQRRRGVVDGSVGGESQMKRMPGPVCEAPHAFGVPRERVPLRELDAAAYDAFCSAPVRCGKSACPGAASLMALETVSGPGSRHCEG